MTLEVLGSVLFVFVFFSGHVLAQVSIKERIAIIPGSQQGGNTPLSFGSDTSECTILLINPAMIYLDPPSGGGTFFWDSSAFQLPAGYSTPVRLHGGVLAGPYLENSPQVGIGADDFLTLSINGNSVVYFDFSDPGAPDHVQFHFIDPSDTGRIISSYVHTGTNTFVARAWDNYPAEDAGVPPLRITVPTNLKFRVTFTPDTTKYTDSSKIVVTAVDANNNPVVIPDATLLMFTIEQSDSIWGYFVDPSGILRNSPLQNVTYGDARAGKVLFVSNGWIDSLGGLRPVNVRVEGGLRVGVGSICLGTVRLKFDGPDSADVYPHWDGHNNTAATVDTLGLILKSVYGSTSIPAKNVLVRIGPPTLIDSGGHSHFSHVVPRPRGKYQVKSGSDWSTVDSIQQATDLSGVLGFRFKATEIGSKELVKAIQVWSAGQLGPETHALKQVRTKVPDMLQFPGAGNYALTGSKDVHPNNHYIVDQAAIDALISAANLFRLAEWNTTGIMRLNDMSLKWGGLFDIDTQWTKSKGHKSHRNGRSVDIENLQLEEIDTISQYTGKDTSFYRPTVDWIAQYIDFMENTVSGWRFVDENQQLKNVYRRTKKWPHFEWTGD
jgi:hypothetical protein